MKTKKPRNFRIFGWLAALAAVLQTIGLIRYFNRLPEDWDYAIRHHTIRFHRCPRWRIYSSPKS